FRAGVEVLHQSERTEEEGTDEHEGLPRSQQHALREAMFRGRAAAEARLALIEHRYNVDWGKLKRGGGADGAKASFFFADKIPEHRVSSGWRDVRSSVFLDALEYIDIVRPSRAAQGRIVTADGDPEGTA